MTSALILKRSGTKDMFEIERAEWKPKTLKPRLPESEKDSWAEKAPQIETVGGKAQGQCLWLRKFKILKGKKSLVEPLKRKAIYTPSPDHPWRSYHPSLHHDWYLERI